MRLCSTCHRAFPADDAVCPEDDTPTRASTAEEEALLERVGTVLDKYRIEGIVGVGGMGVVYRAVHTSLKRPVAIKFIHEEVANNQTMMKRFRDEALRLAALDHDNIVGVSDDGRTADGRYFFVMPLLVGESLTSVMQREAPLPDTRIRTIGADIARGLHAAHEAGVIHRDLKPDNVFLASSASGTQDRIKLLDFGIARQVDTTTSENLTGVGIVLGTPAYMSPEQASGDALDRRADLYSLGTILFEMATRCTPFRKDTHSAMLMAQVVELPPAPSEVFAGVSPALEAVILRCLQKDPKERYATAAELATALDGKTITGSNARVAAPRELATMDTVAASAVASSPPAAMGIAHTTDASAVTPPKRDRRGAVLGLLAAGLVALGIGGYAAFSDGPEAVEPEETGLTVEATVPESVEVGSECPEAEGLRYGGSTTIARFMRRPILSGRDVQVVSDGTVSDGAVSDLSDGTNRAGALSLLTACDVELSGFAGEPGELPDGVSAHHFADDSIAIMVNREHPLRSLGLDELRALLRGESHPELTLLVPPRNSFLRGVLEELRGSPFPESEDGLEPGPTIERLRASTDVIAAASWSDVASLRTLRRVKIDDHGPRTAAYPDELVRPLHLLVRDESAQTLTTWLLSESGQREVAAHHFRRLHARRLLYAGSSSIGRIFERLLEARVLDEGSVELDPSSATVEAPDLLAGRRIDVAGYAGFEGHEPPSSFEPHLLVNDVVAVFVNRTVRFRGAWLTQDQLRQIYSGELTSWSALGGEDVPIVAHTSNVSSALRFDFQRLVLDGNTYGSDVRAVAVREMIETVSRTEGAIGMISYTFLEGVDGVRMVSVNRHTPESPEYPLVRPLYLWTWREARPDVQALLRAVRGEDAQCRMTQMRLRSPFDPECDLRDD